MLRTIGSVLAGYISIGGLVVLSDLIFAAVIPGFRAMAHTAALLFRDRAIYRHVINMIGGGYLCAVCARAAARTATLGLMVFGEIAGVVSTILGWHIQPHWFAVALLVLFPFAVWIGYRLRSRGAQRTLVSSAA